MLPMQNHEREILLCWPSVVRQAGLRNNRRCHVWLSSPQVNFTSQLHSLEFKAALRLRMKKMIRVVDEFINGFVLGCGKCGYLATT